MKKFLKLSVLSLALIGVSSGANAACSGASCTSNNVSATVYTPLTLTNPTSSELKFGIFSPGPGPSNGTIDQAGGTSNGVTAIAGPRSAASYTVTGNTSTNYTISIPDTISLSGPSSSSMTVTLSPVSTSTSSAAGGTLSGASPGVDTITVNGSLSVSPTQTAGVYTGTYTITVSY